MGRYQNFGLSHAGQIACIQFQIELWDEDYNFVRSLSSDTASEEDAEWIADDTTAQSQMVRQLLSDKINSREGFVNCLLRVSLSCLGCRARGSKAGTPIMEFSENSIQNLLYK